MTPFARGDVVQLRLLHGVVLADWHNYILGIVTGQHQMLNKRINLLSQ
jgi:hypothetical protein